MDLNTFLEIQRAKDKTTCEVCDFTGKSGTTYGSRFYAVSKHRTDKGIVGRGQPCLDQELVSCVGNALESPDGRIRWRYGELKTILSVSHYRIYRSIAA